MKRLIPAIALIAAIGSSHADEGFYIPFGLMVYDYDDSARLLDTNVMPTAGAGYRFDNRWAAEVMAARGTTDVNLPLFGSALGLEADVLQYRVDGLYFLDAMNGVTPFAVAGVGENRIDYDLFGDRNDTIVNAGGGVMYQVAENLALRGDVRAIHSLDLDNTDVALNLLAVYQFGAANSAASSQPAPVAAASVASAVDGDDDRDGVANSRDRCPNTARGVVVNNKGCESKIAKEETIELRVLFDTDSAVVKSQYRDEVQAVADFLERHDQTRVTIEGHTDDRGSAAYNKALSQRRANAIRNMLIQVFGADGSRITAVGYGEERPIADNGTAAGQQKNRRVVAVFR